MLPGGIFPERLLLRMSRVRSRGALANFTGMGPKKPLKLKSNLDNNSKSPRLAGIAPVS